MPSAFIPFEALAARLEAILSEAGAAPWIAALLARNCAGCERDGSHSHGVFRVPGYRAALQSGAVDGRAEPVIDSVGPSYLRVDAARGFAQPALERARPTIEAMLTETGAAVVAIRNSHHYSALWPDIEPFAQTGYVALTVVASGAGVIPRGATSKVFGTNPIGFATPVAGSRPLVMDFATSSMANGDLRIARAEGRRVPIGTGVGRGGRDTDDPAEILDEGGLLPFGGHKGMMLSLMVEILAAALTGGAFSCEVDFAESDIPRTGQLLLILDPARGGNGAFATRVAGLLDHLRAAGLDRLPADRRYQARDAAAVHGIPVTDGIRALLT
jgi:delta1-piperideine-2-carboxylate reductase